MSSCALKTSREYQSLKEKTGVSDTILDYTVGTVYNITGKFPRIDEIPGSNTEHHLRNHLNIKLSDDINYTDFKTIEDMYSDIQSATISINKNYPDLNTSLTLIEDTVLVTIDHRPDVILPEEITPVNIDREYQNSPEIIKNLLDKMANLFGIKINTITTEELELDEFREAVSDAKFTKGFVLNGEIYVNTDIATLDTPIHELSHIFMGALRFSDPYLYELLIGSVVNYPNFKKLAFRFSSRSFNDRCEEIFVLEFSKYLVGRESIFDEFTKSLKHNIMYHTKRALDSILDGQISVRTIPNSKLFSQSLNLIGEMVFSNTLDLKYYSFMDLSQVNRRLNSKKEELINNEELIEIC